MRLLFIILFFSFSICYGQKICVQPIISGNFAPSVQLANGNNYSFGMVGIGQNGNTAVSYRYTFLSGSGTLQNANLQSASIINLAAGITSVRLICSDSCHISDTVSIIIQVAAAPNQFTLIFVPNPSRTRVVATLTGPGTGNVFFYLYNPTGTLLGKAYEYKSVSSVSHTFDVHWYGNGNYPVKVTLNNKQVITAIMVIQK